ncbi:MULTISPECIES: DUF6496 domain-containing protein [Mycetohabitans]|nr:MULTISPECIES: DUF6496 domain-containing protein [Mycetohabitans]MCG1048104.1 DNA-binding protein [Mycetohabitans sp. B6]
MPERKTMARAQADKRAGKSASTQAGEFVKEEVEHVRAGKHGVRSAKQAVAIGLSKARRAGIDLKPPKKGATSEATRKKAAKDSEAGQHKTKGSASKETQAKRSRTTTSVLRRERSDGAARKSMSKQAESAAAKRPAASRSAAAKRAAKTKGAAGRSAAAKKAAHTRAARAHH